MELPKEIIIEDNITGEDTVQQHMIKKEEGISICFNTDIEEDNGKNREYLKIELTNEKYDEGLYIEYIKRDEILYFDILSNHRKIYWFKKCCKDDIFKDIITITNIKKFLKEHNLSKDACKCESETLKKLMVKIYKYIQDGNCDTFNALKFVIESFDELQFEIKNHYDRRIEEIKLCKKNLKLNVLSVILQIQSIKIQMD